MPSKRKHSHILCSLALEIHFLSPNFSNRTKKKRECAGDIATRILVQARRRPLKSRQQPSAEGNIVNTLIKLESLGTSERNFICLASKDYLNGYAFGLYRLRLAVRFGGFRYSAESEVSIRKDWCSRVPVRRYSSCSCWLNVVESPNCPVV